MSAYVCSCADVYTRVGGRVEHSFRARTRSCSCTLPLSGFPSISSVPCLLDKLTSHILCRSVCRRRVPHTKAHRSLCIKRAGVGTAPPPAACHLQSQRAHPAPDLSLPASLPPLALCKPNASAVRVPPVIAAATTLHVGDGRLSALRRQPRGTGDKHALTLICGWLAGRWSLTLMGSVLRFPWEASLPRLSRQPSMIPVPLTAATAGFRTTYSPSSSSAPSLSPPSTLALIRPCRGNPPSRHRYKRNRPRVCAKEHHAHR